MKKTLVYLCTLILLTTSLISCSKEKTITNDTTSNPVIVITETTELKPQDVLSKYFKNYCSSKVSDNIFKITKSDNEYIYYDNSEMFLSLSIIKTINDIETLNYIVNVENTNNQYDYCVNCSYFNINVTKPIQETYDLPLDFCINTKLENSYAKSNVEDSTKGYYALLYENINESLDDLFKAFNEEIKTTNISLKDFGLLNY